MQLHSCAPARSGTVVRWQPAGASGSRWPRYGTQRDHSGAMTACLAPARYSACHLAVHRQPASRAPAPARAHPIAHVHALPRRRADRRSASPDRPATAGAAASRRPGRAAPTAASPATGSSIRASRRRTTARPRPRVRRRPVVARRPASGDPSAARAPSRPGANRPWALLLGNGARASRRAARVPPWPA